jgi:glycerol-3-phosphate dehydrogenase
MDRGESLARISSGHFQVLVVGGGITGAGIAWDCALRGMSVALLERTDFAAGTSGVSSKMVHAGLRYITGDPELVRDAARERRWMFDACAPLARPLRYLIPAYPETPEYNARTLAGIIGRYDALGGDAVFRPGGTLDPRELGRGMPGLRPAAEMAGAYWDGVMDDARVNLRVVMSAAEAGAAVCNHAPVTGFLRDSAGRISGARFRDEAPGREPAEHTVSADAVICAAGPFTDLVLALAGDSAGERPAVRPTKGIHIVFRSTAAGRDAVVIPAGSNVLYFLVPFREGYLAMGCTDTDYPVRRPEDLDVVPVEEHEVRHNLRLLESVFPGIFRREDIVACYSGVRPLAAEGSGSGPARSESATSRAHRITRTSGGLWVVTGGKFTTFRLMAEQLVDAVVQDLRARGILRNTPRCATAGARLWGSPRLSPGEDADGWVAVQGARIRRAAGLPADCAAHLCAAYGTAAADVAEMVRAAPSLGARLADGRPYILAEIPYAVTREMCASLADFLYRRTQLRFLETQGLDAAAAAARDMAGLLGWSAAVREEQEALYTAQVSGVWRGRVG